MKRLQLILCTSCTLCGFVLCQGQTLVFSQKSSDLKSLAKQMALLQLYIGWVEKGYQMAQNGLSSIGEIKQGEFNLHSVYFNSLSKVNPEIKKYSKLGVIVSDGIFITQQFKKVFEIEHLTPAEAGYVQTIYSNIMDACTNSLGELIDVISDGDYQMKDDERIRRIDRIYADMESKVLFTRQVSTSANLLSLQRAAEENDIETLQNLE